MGNWWTCLTCGWTAVSMMAFACVGIPAIWPLCAGCIFYGYACGAAILAFCVAVGAC